MIIQIKNQIYESEKNALTQEVELKKKHEEKLAALTAKVNFVSGRIAYPFQNEFELSQLRESFKKQTDHMKRNFEKEKCESESQNNQSSRVIHQSREDNLLNDFQKPSKVCLIFRFF